MYASLTMGCISLFFIEHKQYLLLKRGKNMFSSGFDLALNYNVIREH